MGRLDSGELRYHLGKSAGGSPTCSLELGVRQIGSSPKGDTESASTPHMITMTADALKDAVQGLSRVREQLFAGAVARKET